MTRRTLARTPDVYVIKGRGLTVTVDRFGGLKLGDLVTLVCEVRAMESVSKGMNPPSCRALVLSVRMVCE